MKHPRRAPMQILLAVSWMERMSTCVISRPITYEKDDSDGPEQDSDLDDKDAEIARRILDGEVFLEFHPSMLMQDHHGGCDGE